jgi:chemotaxis protein MotB
MSPRRKRHRAHANHERWLVSYADFITLLFAFFVVLYASSQVDQRKAGKLALAIQVAFQEMGVFPASTTQIPLDINEPMPFSTVQAIQNVKHNSELRRIASHPDDELSASSEDTDISTLQAELRDALHNEIVLREVAMHRETDGLVISLREFGFFDSGSARIKPESLDALNRIASILSIRTYKLRIEGHTDNIPIHTSQFASNWELSTARATEIVRILIMENRFPPDRLSAAGYAEYHPIASNSTAQGRAQNRRVDIVVLTEHGEAQRDDAPSPPVRNDLQKPSPSKLK